MQLGPKFKFDFLDKLTQQKLPILVGGVVAGVLGMWVVGKILDPWVASGCRAYLDRNNERQGYMDAVQKIEAVRVKTGTISRRVTTVGKLLANASVVLKSEISGRIREIHFKDGQDVEQGDLLIEFADDNQRAEVDQAKAELARAEADFKRIASLRERNIESVKKFDEAKAGVDVTKARLDRATADLDKAKIVAPFSGTIGLLQVDPGAYVQAAQELVALVDNTPVYVEFKIPEKFLGDIGVGQTAEIKLDSFPEDKFVASVEALDSRIDEVSHSIAVRASLPNNEGKLREGLFANVSLLIGEKTNALLIPESALAREGNIEFVHIVQEGKAGRRRVVSGTRENGKVEILQGLRPDELVITAGQNKVGDNTPVEIINMPKPEDLLADDEVKEAAKEPAAAEATAGDAAEAKKS